MSSKSKSEKKKQPKISTSVASEKRSSARLKTKIKLTGDVVDDATRSMVRSARLASLENDNYDEPADMRGDDAAYIDEEDDQELGTKKKRRVLPTKVIANTAYKIKSYDQIMLEEVGFICVCVCVFIF